MLAAKAQVFCSSCSDASNECIALCETLLAHSFERLSRREFRERCYSPVISCFDLAATSLPTRKSWLLYVSSAIMDVNVHIQMEDFASMLYIAQAVACILRQMPIIYLLKHDMIPVIRSLPFSMHHGCIITEYWITLVGGLKSCNLFL
jgi:hypothetical protein